MSSLQRSQSAPSVAALQPFLAAARGADRPTRHQTDLAGPSAPTRSGYSTPRGERAEDPFSLGGFFPSQLPGNEGQAGEWTWLRALETDEETHPTPPDDAWLGDGGLPTLDKAEDDEAGEVIRREDKLGVLSFRPAFLSRASELGSGYEDEELYRPYSAAVPEDSDGLHAAYCGLRRAHSAAASPAASGVGTLLYGACEETEGEESGTWLAKGLGMMLEVISV